MYTHWRDAIQMQFCEKRFSEKGKLTGHEHIHKAFKCKVYEKSFPRNLNLIKHERTHTGGSLTGHERTHTDEKPLKKET